MPPVEDSFRQDLSSYATVKVDEIRIIRLQNSTASAIRVDRTLSV